MYLDPKDLGTTAAVVNSWDPHSFPGNGNFADKSLDGWYGRSTDAGVLGNPLTNKRLRERDAYRSVSDAWKTGDATLLKQLEPIESVSIYYYYINKYTV